MAQIKRAEGSGEVGAIVCEHVGSDMGDNSHIAASILRQLYQWVNRTDPITFSSLNLRS